MPRPNPATLRNASRRSPGNTAHAANSHRLIFSTLMPSAILAIRPTVERVTSRLEKLGVLDGHRDAIELALNEALANAVLHGNRKRTEKRVRVACYQQRGGILLVVRDFGSGFDPAKVANPLAAGRITENNGRGIFLIRHFMDEVRFADGGREIRMSKKSR